MKNLRPLRRPARIHQKRGRYTHRRRGPALFPELRFQVGPVLATPGRLIIALDYSQSGSTTVPAKKRRLPAQPPVLSKAARAYAKKVEGSRQLSIKFLKEAG